MVESTFVTPAKIVKLSGIDEGMKVADFGAESGFFTRAAARAVGVGGVVWAVDSRADLLPRIKNVAEAEGLTNVEVVRGEVDHLGGTHLPEATFDAVLVCNTLFGLECKDCLADEVSRVLKVGGIVVLVDWQGSFGGLGPHPDHVITEPQARTLFEQHGFVYQGPLPAGEYHWGCILKKKKTK